MVNQEFVNSSKTFCMAPWSHIHVTPLGNAYPCCLIDGNTSMLGNVNDSTLKELWNSSEMKDIRTHMLLDKPHKSCTWCHVSEKDFGSSFRKDFNEKYSFNLNLVNSTHADGTVEQLEMRYIDIRFSNICNLKCRMCGPQFSSQFAAELGIKPAIKQIPLTMLSDVIEYLHTCEEIYFAGGEPLIMDEHYLLLEKLIELNLRPRIRYNTNLTTLKYKNWSIIDLWSKFDKIYVQGSMDGYNNEMRYIRFPSDYTESVDIAKIYKEVPGLTLDISSVVGFWNIWSLPEFHADLLAQGVINNISQLEMQPMIHPADLSTKVLPSYLKEEITHKLQTYIDSFKTHTHIEYVNKWKGIINFMNSEDHFKKWKDTGKTKVMKLDHKRKQNFIDTFPHLAGMMYD